MCLAFLFRVSLQCFFLLEKCENIIVQNNNVFDYMIGFVSLLTMLWTTGLMLSHLDFWG